MTNIDRHAIATRIRGLIGASGPEAVEQAAEQLGVTELALRLSIDPDSPHPVIDVIVSVVREYGVDPTWLLTGEYVTDTHRLAEEDELGSLYAALDRIGHKTETPVHAMLAVLR